MESVSAAKRARRARAAAGARGLGRLADDSVRRRRRPARTAGRTRHSGRRSSPGISLPTTSTTAGARSTIASSDTGAEAEGTSAKTFRPPASSTSSLTKLPAPSAMTGWSQARSSAGRRSLESCAGGALGRQLRLQPVRDGIARGRCPDGLTQHPRRARDVAEAVGAEPEYRDAQLAEAGGGPGVAGGVIQDDEIRPSAEDRLQRRWKPTADAGNGGRAGRIVARAAAGDETGASAEGEEQLGGGRVERDDAAGRRALADALAGIVHERGARGRATGRPTGG